MSNIRKPWPAGLSIRATRLDDAEPIAEMAALPGFRAGTLRLPYQRLTQTKQWLESLGNDAINLVAVLEGRVVGNAGLERRSGRRAHVAGIGMGVHDDFAGRGIGTALLGELVDTADNWLNLKRLELNVYTDNLSAIRLYEHFGFKPEGVHLAYAYRDGSYADSLAMGRLRL